MLALCLVGIHSPAKRKGLFASAGRVIICLQRIRPMKNGVASNRRVIAAATLLAFPI